MTTLEIVPLSSQEFNELCRLCAAKTNVLVGLPIFEDEGDTRQIFKKIRACLPVQVASTDRLPKMVCEECVYKLDLLFDFRERSLRTERYLESVLAKVSVSVMSPNNALCSSRVLPPSNALCPARVISPSNALCPARMISPSNALCPTQVTSSNALCPVRMTSSLTESPASSIQVTPVATATLTLTTPVLLLAPLTVSRPNTSASVASNVVSADDSTHLLPMPVQSVTLLQNQSRASCVVDGHTNGVSTIREANSQVQVAPHQLLQPPQEQLQHLHQQPTSHHQQQTDLQPRHHHHHQPQSSPTQTLSLPPPQQAMLPPPHQLHQHLTHHCSTQVNETSPLQEQTQSVQQQNEGESLILPQGSKHLRQEEEQQSAKKTIGLQVRTESSTGWISATQPSHQELQCEPDVFIKIEEHEVDVYNAGKISSGDDDNGDNDNREDDGEHVNINVPEIDPDVSDAQEAIVTEGKGAVQERKSAGNNGCDVPVILSVFGDFSKETDTAMLPDEPTPQQSKPTQPLTSSPDIHCKTCNGVFPNQEQLNEHCKNGCTMAKINETPKEVSVSDTSATRKKWEPKVCSECGKEYRTNYKLREHMRRHTGERPFRCSLCPKAFRSKIGLAQHEARHTGEFEFSCDSCGKGFQCKSYLIVHQRVHSDEKPYPCSTCGRRFKMRQSLLDHQNRHLGVKPYLCETCGRRFVTKGLCKSHQRIHSGTDNRRHPCTVCGKMFVSKSYLATHLRIHTGEKPFMCEVCGKGFLTRVDLRIHATVHTGEKSFQCEWCGKAFARRDALRCHRRSHTGERPYTCEVCGQSFTQFSPLTIHKRLHTGERPYACDICSKGFVSRSTMMAHRKKCSS